MPADNDSVMLERLGYAVVDLQVKYRAASLADRLTLRPQLEDLLEKYAAYQVKLLEDGIITTDADLQAMDAIRAEIDQAADTQKLITALARTIAFVASKA